MTPHIVPVEHLFVVLLDPPVSVWLRHTGEAGQLLAAWYMHIEKRWENTVRYRIRYSSKLLGEKTEEVQLNEHFSAHTEHPHRCCLMGRLLWTVRGRPDHA